MSRIEEPKTEDNDGRGTKTTHPAFGQIVVSRVHGSAILYGSDFSHNNTMRITISASELHRDLYSDHYYGGKDIIEVEMSESQWATFISSPNIGSGPPCTIRRVGRELMPGLPAPMSRDKQFAGEMDQKLAECVTNLGKTIDSIDAMGLPKGKANEIKSALNHLHTELKRNIPFVASQFGEHVETVVEKAKQEIHGYMHGVIQRAGIKAIQSEMPLEIEHKETDQ